MSRLPMLMAALVLMTTEVEGCDDDRSPDPLPPISVAAAERKVTEKLEAEALGPFTLACEAVSHSEYVQDYVDCAVDRQGRSLRVTVFRGFDGVTPTAQLSRDGRDVARFVEQTLGLVGAPVGRVACKEIRERHLPCRVRTRPGGPRTDAWVLPHGYFYDVTVHPQRGRATAVGGGPRVDLDLGRARTGGRSTLQGTARPHRETDLPVTQVCAWADLYDEHRTCVVPDRRGQYAITHPASPYSEHLSVEATDAAGATTELVVPMATWRLG